jgi:hypothetical protein
MNKTRQQIEEALASALTDLILYYVARLLAAREENPCPAK